MVGEAVDGFCVVVVVNVSGCVVMVKVVGGEVDGFCVVVV